MKDEEKQIEEMAKMLVKQGNLHCDNTVCSECEYSEENEEITCQSKLVATLIYEQGYRKLPEGSVVLSMEEYSKNLNTHYYMGQRETEVYYKTLKIPHASKETAEKILNTDFFVFETENRSEEYQKGYMQAVRECRSRRDELAKQFGVEIKE